MGLFDKLFGPPSRDKFARMVMRGIRQAGEEREIRYDAEGFQLCVDADDNCQQFFLGNPYQEYCEAPKEVREQVVGMLVQNWFRVTIEVPEDFEDAMPDLLPVVRSRSYFDMTKLHVQIQGGEMADWACQLVGDHLAAAVAYDLPQFMQLLPDEQFDKWGVTFYEAMEVARRNLDEREHAFFGPAEGDGVYMSASNDNYDASRLLLLDRIRKMNLGGDPIAIVANRDTLLVGGADDVAGLTGMLALAKDALQKPRAISALPLRLDGDEWVSWLPEASHPLYEEFRELALAWNNIEYNDQKELLDKLYEKTGEDIFVSSYMIYEKPPLGPRSACVWGNGCRVLLPRTEWVSVMPNVDEEIQVPWDRVVEVAGHLMKEEDMYPTRYRVTEFPTEAELAAMGDGAL